MNGDLLEHVLDVSRKMAETRALTPLLNYVLDEAINLIGAERGYTVLCQPGSSVLDFRSQRGLNGTALNQPEDQVSKSVLNQVINSGVPLVLRDAMNDARFRGAVSVETLKLRSIMCVPLIAHGETIGAIYVENRSIQGRFSESNLPPLILFANQAAVAIENATLNEELESRVAQRTQELAEAKSLVEKSWAEAVEANRLRTEWLNKVVHDLRAPLVIITGSLSLIKDGKLGELNQKQVEWLNKSLETVNFVAALTDDLFEMSKLEAGVVTLHPEDVNLEELLHQIYDTASGLPWPKTVSFDLNISSDLPQIHVDPLRVRQILLNLIGNAHKFTDNGSVTMHACYLPEQKEIQIGVADTGEGISVNQQHHLFDRFQQMDSNLARRRTGAGLGLAICRELVEMHQGRIWVKSELDIGSNFVFTLPVR